MNHQFTYLQGEELMFYKGDFHIHSNYSDGKFSVNELLDLYKESGYNFRGCVEI